MNNRLEQFVRDHREEFDGEEPDDKIWEAIQKGLGSVTDPNKKKPAPVVRLYRIKWSVAAAVVLLIAGTAGYLSLHRHPGSNQPAVAASQGAKPATSPAASGETPSQAPAQSPAGTDTDDSHSLAGTGTAKPQDHGAAAGDARTDDNSLDASVNEEMYHYAKLVEIKHKELKTIEKDEPLLYRQFAGDVNKLDSVYHGLQSQLTKNPNREQILEAMLQNLQLQMGLLNHQLDIIKQINHSKKTEYEKAYKTL